MTTDAQLGKSTARGVVSATVADTARVVTQVLIPTVAGGVIKRRPAVMAIAEKLQADKAAVDLMVRLRARYGETPLRLRIPGRSIDLAMSGEDVGALLAATPSPFSPATKEKRAALGHFQPHGVLISDPGERPPRREFTEKVLEPGRPLHELAAPFAKVLREEAAEISAKAGLAGVLGWDAFNVSWWNMVRRVVLGDRARNDEAITDLLERLRLDANWAYAHPRREKTREQFDRRLREHLDRAEKGSLAAAIAAAGTDRVDPADQVPHWLFAFDAASMVTFRTLALLATHPDAADHVRAELRDSDPRQPQQYPYLRACVLESVRLWPTTPALLRESTDRTAWGPAGTTVLIFTPFFHRDPEKLSYADRFEPEIWLDGRAAANPALVPFSGGPGICPGRDLVLFCAATMLADLCRDRTYGLRSGPSMGGEKPLPRTIDNFHLRLGVE